MSGVRTPHPIAELEKLMPAAYKQLRETTTRLERHYKDVQDFEFTIQENTLYMLQTRNGKRTGLAAINIAVDMCEEGVLTKKEALLKVGGSAEGNVFFAAEGHSAIAAFARCDLNLCCVKKHGGPAENKMG